MMEIMELQNKYASIKQGAEKLRIYKSLLEKKNSKLEAEAEHSKNKVEMYVKCSEIFKRWLEDSIEKNVESISNLISTGLNYVIHDQNLSFKIKQEQKNNRIHMKFVLEQDGVEGDPLASFGGGAAVVISLILRLSIMQRTGLGNLLILDESMVALANAYVPNAASFMRQLSEQTGVNILMVTHNPEFINNAHTAYECYKTDSLHLKSIVKTVP